MTNDENLTTCNCRWNGDTQVSQCELHNAHVNAIHEWADRAKKAEGELAAARARIAELEKAQTWHPASEPPETTRDVVVWDVDGDWFPDNYVVGCGFPPDITHWRDIDKPKTTREE